MTLQAKQSLHQRLLLAPNVTLALEILRMPTMELRAFLERQLEENPCLEMAADEACAQDEESEAPPEDNSNSTSDAPAAGLDEDWLSHWGSASAGNSEQAGEDDGAQERIIEQRLAMPQSLYESLRMQLGCQQITEEERGIGETLITHLDDFGYLDVPLLDLATELHIPLERLETLLTLIQRFDPPGVGARDLRECLMIQAEQAGAHEGLAYRILRDHFELFAHHRLTAIAKATRAALDDVVQACEWLKRLNPKPGRAFANDLPPSVIPDLIIHHREKHYDVELNDQEVPRVAVSRAYYRMLKDARTPSDAKEFLVSKFQKANWLIKAIDERNATLLSIARCLISLQREFLEQGPPALKPLTQAQVASLIGRHSSTVSRAISGKTIDTPCGIFRLEQLFASGVPQTEQTDSISDEKIKSELERLVASEDPCHPLSDAALAKHLAEQQIIVARRTVAKYRAALKILPAHLRKRPL